MSQILFSINISKFNVSYLPVEIDQLDKNRKLLVQELNLTKPDSRKALYFAKEFVRTVSSINVIIPTFVLDQETNKFIDSLEEAASFLPKIELYQQLTDKKQLKLFTESLDSVLASLSVIKSLEDSTQKQIITSHLDIIENLLSKTVKVSDKQALIGFPRGSLDVQLLFKDLDDEWLKKVLNNGNTLRELKCILNPIRIFQAQILMENKWKKYDRNVSSTLIRRSRIKFESIVASKPISISNAIENAKNTLRALRPLDYLKNSELDKFKQLLISSSIFTNLSKELIELKNCSHSVQDVFHSTMNIAFSKTVPMKNDPDKLVAYLKENFMNNQYASFVHQFSTKFRFLEKQRKQIVKVLSQTINIKSTLTDQIFINIRHLCTQLNSDLKTVQNYVKLLNSLSPLTNIERVATEELPSMLSSARNVMDKWRELWEDNKTKNKTTQSFHRLAYFPFARETSFQLACSQRALMLYQKHDLRQKLQNFASNGCALAKKIESVPQVKKQFNDSDWRHFLSINKSITILLSGVEKLSRRLTTGDQSLKSFGNTLSVLDHINVSTFNFSLMIRILEKLKTMSIGQSREVSDFENILKQLEGLQFAAMRRKNSHIILLAHTGNFFQSFFSKQSKSDW
uniref:Uncharacterized protein n=1 Tax=Caenorhabditis japonica TaxID=281687 RepID=A0A8R1EHB9_CAEJA